MTIEFTRLNHITFTAPSGEEAKIRWFYGEVLGLKEVPIPDKLKEVYEIVWFKLLDYLFHIEFSKNYVRPPENSEKEVILPGRHMALEVKNILEVRHQLEKKGVEIRNGVPLADRERFYIVDPFGNYIELIEFHQK